MLYLLVSIKTIGFSFSKDLNNVLLGLKETTGRNIFHLIDHTTHYNSAKIGKTKIKEQTVKTVKAVLQIWITLF